MPVDQLWRYILGTILLLVAAGMAIAACFGAVAEAGTFEVQALGAKVKASSIVVLSIVLFVVAALFLLRANKKLKETKTNIDQGGSISDNYWVIRPHLGLNNTLPLFILHSDRFVRYALAIAGIVIVISAAITLWFSF